MTITLLSDLGTADASAAIAKAVLMQYAPADVIADISHYVAQYDLRQAAYLLLSSYRHFPAGSIHIVLVDVFSGDSPKALLAAHDGRLFIAPDNGILPLAFGTLADTRLCFEPAKPYHLKSWMHGAGKAIQRLFKNGTGEFSPYDIKKAPAIIQPRPMPGGVECNILYIDRYGNVVLDITEEQFEKLIGNKPFSIKILRTDITGLSNNYNDVKPGSPLCRLNDAGFLEIAVNRERASSLLGLEDYSAASLRYQSIKLFFDRK